MTAQEGGRGGEAYVSLAVAFILLCHPDTCLRASPEIRVSYNSGVYKSRVAFA